MSRLAALLLLVFAACGAAGAGELLAPLPTIQATVEILTDGAHIRAPGWSNYASPGDPDLPSQDLTVILPPEADLSSVSVELTDVSEHTLAERYDVAPAPPVVTVVDGQKIEDWGTGKQIEAGRNILVYGKDDFYPQSRLQVTETGRMRGWQVVRVRYYPYRHNPVSQLLEVVSSGSMRVVYESRSGVASSSQPYADDVLSDMLRSIAVNYVQASSWYYGGGAGPQVQQDPAQYLIVTTTDIVQSSTRLQDFINHKMGRGFSVDVATEAAWGGGTGDTAANNIRNYLKSNYLSRQIKYVLFIGNPDPGSSVPMKMLWPRHNSDTYREAPSDYFYADLTGNWDLDGDGFFGEEDNDFGPGGVDRYPEVIVGRIPYYGSISDLDSILGKIINYESGRNAGPWMKNVLLSMEPSDDKTPGYTLGEAIKNDAALAAGYTATRVYNDVYGLNPPAEYIPCNYDNVLSAWQQHAGFHIWWTHGSVTSAADVFSTAHCQYLDNDYSSFVFQASCSNAYPEISTNLSYSLLKQGALATVGATRVSWYYPGETTYANSDSNAGMAYKYALKIIRDHIACGDARLAMMVGVPRTIWMNHCVFNLYGDPSLRYLPGPAISHTPLPNTEDRTSPYTVQADIDFSFPLLSGNPVMYWNTGTGNYTAVTMQPVGPGSYSAQIPPQEFGTTVYYYISAADAAGHVVFSPSTAPTTPYSFKVFGDATPPAITHVPLVDTGDRTGPYVVKATITDDSGVASAILHYKKNGGPEQAVPMQATSPTQFQGQIPGPSQAGDSYSYYITAVDSSVSANAGRFPESGSLTFAIMLVRPVVVLNNLGSPSYFIGGNSNAWSPVVDILNSDPARRFTVTVATNLNADTIAGQEVIVLPDNAVATADLQAVADWFVPGKTILAMDSSVCYAAYSGFMWPSAAGTNGHNVYWDYGSSSNDQQVWLSDPVTASYAVGQLIDSKNNDVQLYVDKLPPDAKALTGRKNNPNRCYVAYRDVPGRGRIIVLGPYVTPSSGQYALIRDAIAPDQPAMSIAEAKAASDGLSIKLSNKIVTCNVNGRCYVQEPDRLCGLRIICSLPLARLSLATLYGTMSTVNGERVLNVRSVQTVSTGQSVQPWALRTADLGGGALGLQQPIAEYRLAPNGPVWSRSLVSGAGPNNIGLFVRVFGRVTAVTNGFFYIDDGCGCDDGSGYVGVRVLCEGMSKPAVGQHVIVDAVSSTYFERGSLFRALALPSADCVRVVASSP